MKEPIVTDSTCLIGLERIGQLDLLPALFEPIVIPPEVNQEFAVAVSWLRVETPSVTVLIAALKMLVDAGEAEAIALASERGCRVVLDDRKARSVARSLGVPIIGTVGILLRAKQSGVIPLVKPILDALEARSFYVSGGLKEEALLLAGE